MNSLKSENIEKFKESQHPISLTLIFSPDHREVLLVYSVEILDASGFQAAHLISIIINNILLVKTKRQ